MLIKEEAHMAEFRSWKKGVEKGGLASLLTGGSHAYWLTEEARNKAICVLFEVIRVTNWKTKNQCPGGRDVGVV